MRRFLRYFGIVIAVAVVLAIVGILSFATPPVRAGVRALVMQFASNEHMQIAFDELDGWPPFSFTVRGLKLSDKHGVFASVPEAEVTLDGWALLRGRVALPIVRAQAADIARWPDLPPSQNSAKNNGQDVLPALALGELSLGRLGLETPVLGQAASLSVHGGVDMDPMGAVVGVFTFKRLDGPKGMAVIDIQRPSPSKPFSLKMLAEEERNGLLLASLGQSAGPAYKLDVTAEGDFKQIGGRLMLSTDGRDSAQARFQATPNARGWTATAKFSGNLDAMVPQSFADILRGPLSGELDVDVIQHPASKAYGLTLRQADAAVGAATLTAQGALGEGGDNLSFALRVASRNGQPLRLLAGALENLEMKGMIATRSGLSRAEVTGQINGFAQSGWYAPRLDLSLTTESDAASIMAATTLPFSAALVMERLTSPQGQLYRSGEPITLEAGGLMLKQTLTSARLRFPGGTVAFSGDATSQKAMGEAKIEISDGTPLNSLLGAAMPAFSAMKAVANGQLYASRGDSVFDLAAQVSDLRLKAGDAVLLPGASALKARVTLHDGGATGYEFSRFTLENAVLNASGDVALRKDALAGDVRAAMADLSRLSAGLSGKAMIEARLGGTLALPEIDGTLTVPTGRVGAHPLENAVIALKSTNDGENLIGRLQLSGRYAHHPLSGVARAVRSASGGVSVPELDLAIGSNRVQGLLKQVEGGLMAGNLALKINDLSQLSALALIEARGQGTANVRLEAEGGRQNAIVAGDLTDLSLSAATISTITLNGKAADLFGVPHLEGRLRADNVRHGTLSFTRIDGKASSAPAGVTLFEAKGDGPEVDLEAFGRLEPLQGGSGLRMVLERGKATARGIALRIRQPSSVTMQGERLHVDGFHADLGGGKLDIAGDVRPGLTLDMRFSDVPASLANRFSDGLEASGSVSGAVAITGSLEEPKADWRLRASSLHMAAMAKAGVPPLAIEGEGVANKTGTSLNALVSGAGARLSLSGHATYDGKLDIKATGPVPLAPLAAASGREMSVAGQVNVAMDIGGTVQKPSIGGHADLMDARVIDGASGFGVRGTRGRLVFRNDRLTLENVQGALLNGGAFNVAGAVGVTPGEGFPADLRLNVQNGRYSDGQQINADFSASLSVKGALMGQSHVNGAINVTKLEIALPDRIGRSPTRIAVEHRNAGRAMGARSGTTPRQAPRRAKTAGFGSQMNLDVAINALNAIYVRGGGLDAELGGNVSLGGTVANPMVTGAFDMRRGRFSILSRRMDFTRGRITFVGDPTPVVDFEASALSDSFTLTVGVRGAMNQPELIFSSSPELNSEEVISRLLFGRGVANLSPVQVAQLVSEIARLTGLTSGPGAIERLRQSFGLDDLDVRQDAMGNTEVGIGKRINDRMRLGIEQGVNAGQTKAVIDLDLTRNIKLRGETSNTGAGKIGITVEKEY